MILKKKKEKERRTTEDLEIKSFKNNSKTIN